MLTLDERRAWMKKVIESEYAELQAENERLKSDLEADTRLLEIMRQHAKELGIGYQGDQEYLVAVKALIELLRAEKDKYQQQLETFTEAVEAISRELKK